MPRLKIEPWKKIRKKSIGALRFLPGFCLLFLWVAVAVAASMCMRMFMVFFFFWWMACRRRRARNPRVGGEERGKTFCLNLTNYFLLPEINYFW